MTSGTSCACPVACCTVACRRVDVVELWALHTGSPELPRAFRAFGTGQPLPAEPTRHVGTSLAAAGRLVWHVMESV